MWLVDGRRGKILQLRPKAAHGGEHTWVLDDEGDWVQATPRGFYLRSRFTRELIKRHLGL
jgi:DNA mismatch repair protein MutH